MKGALALLLVAVAMGASAYLQQKHWESQRVSVDHMRIAPTPLTSQEAQWIAQSTKSTLNGWIQLSIAGEPYARGFQHGYAMASDFLPSYAAASYFALQSSGMTMEFFNELGVKIFADNIPNEMQQEMQGIADGMVKAGVNVSYDTILGWNANSEIAGYYWPTIAGKYASSPRRVSNAHCSAFAATGSATPDGRPVIGHTTFVEFILGQSANVMLTLTPSAGAQMVFQTFPGYISSMTDFWIASSGLAVTETTLAGFSGFNVDGIPEFVRVRESTQYATSITEWIAIMSKGNNGGYANSWILADMNTGEIGEFEQGLTYTYTNIVSDGTLHGDNVANSPQIRNLECADTGVWDVRQQTGARSVRWPQLLEQYAGNITVDTGVTMLGDTYDPYLNKENPCSRCICGMYDVDPQYFVSDPNAVWNQPFWPAGSIDGKVASAATMETMSLYAVFGRANGVAFDAPTFLEANPIWAWQGPYLLSRPAQPWTMFSAPPNSSVAAL